jgi:hypothetical protein
MFLVISLGLLFYIFTSKTKRKSIDIHAQLIIVTFLLGIVVNAIVVGSLANVYDRLQSRISWMHIFCMLLLVLSKKEFLKKKTASFLSKKKSD